MTPTAPYRGYVAKFLYMYLDFFLPIGKKIHKDEIPKITAAKISLGSKVFQILTHPKCLGQRAVLRVSIINEKQMIPFNDDIFLR